MKKASRGRGGVETLSLFPELAVSRGDEESITRRGMGQPAKSALETAARAVMARKLVMVYGYSEKDLIAPTDLPQPLRSRLQAFTLIVLSKDRAPTIAINCRIERAEDAKKLLGVARRKEDWGVPYIAWTNGCEHIFLHRGNGDVWREIPDLPRRGEDVGDIGWLVRRDLVIPETLLPEFADIRNHLAANATGVTRDETIAREVIKLLFCKIYDEQHSDSAAFVEFCAQATEPPASVKRRIETKLLRNLHGVWGENADEWSGQIMLDPDSVCYVVGLLQHYEITSARRDVIGQAFESLIGPTLRGDEGQFFTPRNVVRMAVGMVDPKPEERVIDPACGSGGFLAAVCDHVRQTNGTTGENGKRSMGRPHEAEVYGIEKDRFLAAIAQANLALVGKSKGRVFCDDALKAPTRGRGLLADQCPLGSFDVVVTNPPFGAKIPVKGEQKLQQFQLGRVWRRRKDRSFEVTEELAPFRPPQILFIERCLDLLKEGGRMAIVLPDGILGNVNHGYVRQFLSARAELIAIIDCPLETFLPSTPTKTSIVVLRKKTAKAVHEPVFMAIAEKCGHDRRGRALIQADGSLQDDFPAITAEFQRWKAARDVGF